MNSEKRKGRLDLLLIGILLVSVFLNFYNIGDSGSNSYYTAAAKSMTDNFKAFFFASLDSENFITVDKPPVALWFQALSVMAFGLSDVSVLLPEAIASVISVFLMYKIVKPFFGRVPALWASLILACTPIFVAVTRTNNVDSILICVLLIATWALMKSIQQQKLSWLLLSVALVGVGFNIKMLQAYLILPAFYLFYFLASKVNWKKRILHLVLATVMLSAVSVSYAVVVELTPEDERPYIGGSETNSVLELAFGYNGIQRLTGQQSSSGGEKQSEQSSTSAETASSTDSTSSNSSATTNEGFSQGGPQMGQDGQRSGSSTTGAGGENIGEAGVFRLFSSALSGQISWLLSFVIFSSIAVAVSIVKERKFDIHHKFAIFWMMWLLPMAGFFSVASFYHRYYLSMMGPGIAAMVAIGIAYLWQFYKDKQGLSQWLLPISILSTFLLEAYILYQNNASVSTVWIVLTALLGVVVFGLLIFFRRMDNAAYYIQVAGMLGLLIMPMYWTVTTVFNGVNTTMPTAGPSSGTSDRGMAFGDAQGTPPSMGESGSMQPPSMSDSDSSGQTPPSFEGGTSIPNSSDLTDSSASSGMRMGGGMGGGVDSDLLSYLEENYDGEKWMVATTSANSAAQIILNSDKAVMAMGGFAGSDPALTVEKLEEMVKNGDIKFFILDGRGGMGSNSEVTTWIQENCVEVTIGSDDSTSDTTTDDTAQRGGMNTTLYKYEG